MTKTPKQDVSELDEPIDAYVDRWYLPIEENASEAQQILDVAEMKRQLKSIITQALQTQKDELLDWVEREVVDSGNARVLNQYPTDVFPEPSDADREKFNVIDANAHTRIHTGGIRHGLTLIAQEQRQTINNKKDG